MSSIALKIVEGPRGKVELHTCVQGRRSCAIEVQEFVPTLGSQGQMVCRGWATYKPTFDHNDPLFQRALAKATKKAEAWVNRPLDSTLYYIK